MTTMMVVVGVCLFEAYIRNETEVMCLYKREKKIKKKKKGSYSQQNAMGLCNSLSTLLKCDIMHFCGRFILIITIKANKITFVRT